MTGTAATEAAEFWDVYKMNVVEIPTTLPSSVSMTRTSSIKIRWTSLLPLQKRSKKTRLDNPF